MLSPKVTVSLITYNHAPYIAEAIESVLMQRTTFPVELVIGEDESSDGTREIVQRFAAQYPDRIRLHLHSRSANISYQGRPTSRRNFVNNVQSARGEYIALLDGDDYWTDPEKLQRQADFLDAHAECGTCFHRVMVVDQKGELLPADSEIRVVKPVYDLADLLSRKFLMHTASVMFRRGLFADFPDWYYDCPVSDFPLHVLNGLRCGFGLVDREMAAYRVHAGGIWSTSGDSNRNAPQEYQRKLRQVQAVTHLYETLLAGIGPTCSAELRDGITFYRYQTAHLLRRVSDWSALREMAWKVLQSRPLPGDVPILRVCALLMQGYLPWTARAADQIRALLSPRKAST
jgi:hypothetical protein